MLININVQFTVQSPFRSSFSLKSLSVRNLSGFSDFNPLISLAIQQLPTDRYR